MVRRRMHLIGTVCRIVCAKRESKRHCCNSTEVRHCGDLETDCLGIDLNFSFFFFVEAHERKEALTKRPLDFEKEEETRKDETMKWLESHFGSESRSSRGSRDDLDAEPTKKSFFNVTIKSNPASPSSPIGPSFPNSYHSNAIQHSKIIPEKETPKETKYFKGISEWAERKEPAPRVYASKTFQEELKGTLERNKLRQVASREELRTNRVLKSDIKSDDEVDKMINKTELRYGSRGDLGYRRDSRGGSDDSRYLKQQREDLGYMSGSRNDLRPRNDSKDELYAKSKRQATYLHREDSGYVKDSREDVRYIRNTPAREDSFIRDSGEDERLYREPGKYNKTAIQRDDSAYVSSSTYFTEPRSPKTIPLRTPDSGIRSPSPDTYDSECVRPTVPQRKRAIEKKLRVTQNGFTPSLKLQEPPPDYAPSPRSRSISPLPAVGHKKLYQKTRFASSTELSRPVATNTIETQTTPPKKKVGSAIGNSIRKLVGKIRSVSSERKLKSKSKNQASSNSKQQSHNGGSTYQQYNTTIDSHIGQPPQQSAQQRHMSPSHRESSIVSNGRRERSFDRRGSSDVDGMAIPKQKYYLGEDPYGGSIYGKENKYDGARNQQQRHQTRRQRSEDIDVYSPSRYVLHIFIATRLAFDR